MIFKDVELEWDNEKFAIPSNKVLGAIALIEEHFTFQDLANAMTSNKLSLTALARTYGDVLRYAGATVTDDEVYSGMFAGDMSGKIFAAVNMLLAMMIPPSALIAIENAKKVGGPARGNGRAPRGRVTAKPSRRSTKRSSVVAR